LGTAQGPQGPFSYELEWILLNLIQLE